jgi:arylformamidase
MQIYDITPLIHSGIAVFPGDVVFEQKTSMTFANGDHLMLSSMQSTLHLGAHADASNHYTADGQGISSIPLGVYMGRAQVIRPNLSKKNNPRLIEPADLENKKILAPRVLFATESFSNPNQWHNDFTSLSAELIYELAKQDCLLVGIDTPSVDPATSKDLPSHQALAKTGIRVLEGLVLSNVPEGLYTLLALPLPIVNGDASPVRAVLISEANLFSTDPRFAKIIPPIKNQ